MNAKKVWLITGAGRGLGVDIVKAALAAGHEVVATGRDAAKVATAIGDHDTDQGEAIVVGHSYTTSGEFEFTAVQIDFPIGHAVPSVLRSYGPVHSQGSPSFGAGGLSGVPDAHPMELVPTAPVATVSSSWGRLKALYR